jgi:hypothetical protein
MCYDTFFRTFDAEISKHEDGDLFVKRDAGELRVFELIEWIAKQFHLSWIHTYGSMLEFSEKFKAGTLSV